MAVATRVVLAAGNHLTRSLDHTDLQLQLQLLSLMSYNGAPPALAILFRDLLDTMAWTNIIGGPTITRRTHTYSTAVMTLFFAD